MPSLPPELKPLLSACSALIPDAEAELRNPPWDEAPSRILIARLSPFRDDAGSTSHLVLFAESRAALPDAFIDFAFFPERADRELLSRQGLPWFYGLASGRGPADFDLVMVSNAFGLELLNLPYLFSTSALPARASERREAGVETIFILGGSNAAACGCLLFDPRGRGSDGGSDGEEAKDSFVDGIFFGEGEGALGDLARSLARKGDGGAAEARLSEAEGIPGFWRAGSGRTARRRVAARPRPLRAYPILNSEEASTARLQISAGCPGFCSFCLEGWDRRPYRELSLPELLDAGRALRSATGADTLEVYSFNFNTHAEVFSLVFELGRLFRRVNFMSQRLDILAATPGLVRAELAADKRSFTLGIEGISKRMRAYYRKGLTDEGLNSVLERLIAPGVRELKLFYIVSGLEDESDLEEFEAFAAALRGRREASAPGLRLLVSVGYLVRLPFTPLQFAPLALEAKALRRIGGPVEAACERNGLEYRLAVPVEEYLADQLLSLGGSRLAPWLESLPVLDFVYDRYISRGAWPSLEAYARDVGLFDPSFSAQKAAGWRPPLAFIESEGHHEVLWRNYVEARRGHDRAPCLGAACSDCGACADGEERLALTGHETKAAPPGYLDRLTRLVAAKAAFPRAWAAVELPPSLAGALSAYRSAWVMRRIAAFAKAADAKVADAKAAVATGAAAGLAAGSSEGAASGEGAVFEAAEILFTEGSASFFADCLPGFTGACAFELRGPDAARMRAAAAVAGFAPLEGPPSPSRVEVSIELADPFAAGAARAFREWLAEERIDILELHSGADRLIRPTARDAKKHVIYEALLCEGAGVHAEGGPRASFFRARLTIGPKARIGDWLGRLPRGAARSALIRVLSYR